MIVTNMPYSWALIRRAFGLNPFLRDADDITIHSVPVETGRVLRPLASNSTAAALDKLYPIDDIVVELIEERENQRDRGDMDV